MAAAAPAPKEIASKLAKRHVLELAAMSDEELSSAIEAYQSARLEIMGRLAQVRRDSFSAQQHRGTLLQIEAGIRTMIRRLNLNHKRSLQRVTRRSSRHILAEIREFEGALPDAVGRIQTEIVQRFNAPDSLVMHQFETSMGRYGGTVVGEIQRRLTSHAIQRSTWVEMSTDIAGRLRAHAIRGAQWRAERVVRTELIDAANATRQEMLEGVRDTYLPDLKRQWDATNDARICEICRSLHMQVRALDEPFVDMNGKFYDRPTAHPNCRCAVVPYRDEWLEMGLEAA